MKDNKGRIKAFYDAVEMTEDFRERMLRLAEERGPAKKPGFSAWKPTLCAAVIAVVCFTGFLALDRTGAFPWPDRSDPSGGTLQESTRQTSADPAAEPTASEPTWSEAGETTPAVEPPQTDPKPTDPQPTDPQPTDPQPTDPKPTDPQPTDPQPTDPQPTDPQPTDPQPTDPQPTDPQPTDPQPTDPPPTDPQPTVYPGVPSEEFTLTAVYTHADSLDLIVITLLETGETATVDVTGRITEEGYSEVLDLFGYPVLVELTPDGTGGYTASAAVV